MHVDISDFENHSDLIKFDFFTSSNTRIFLGIHLQNAL